MYVIGIGGSDHDFSCALCKDGRIIVAVEEERITRKKHGIGIVETLEIGKSVDYCLKYGQIGRNDISMVVSNDILNAAPLFGFKQFLSINHHLAHAASSYFASGFVDSAILVVDAAGSVSSEGVETATLAVGHKNNIEVLFKIYGTVNQENGYICNSIGQLYTIVTEGIGFHILQEGKTMGLAPYGTMKYYDYLKNIVKLNPDGKYTISHLDLVDCSLFIKSEQKKSTLSSEDLFQVRADFARAVQEVTNDTVLHMAGFLRKSTTQNNLCYSGGVALNSVTNGKIADQHWFNDYFVQPGSGDSGTAIGSALWGYYCCSNEGKNDISRYPIGNSFLGREYNSEDIKTALDELIDKKNVTVKHSDNITEDISKILSKGFPICVYNGKSEFGPRALGNRSILCSATESKAKDMLNDIKRRERFRPFAPAVLYDKQQEYFNADFISPYMLFVFDVRDDKANIIPAVTHVDQTARIQSVTSENAPYLNKILCEYYKITRVPVLINTSFNIGYEPIVETPLDAIKSFLKSEIAYLALDDYLIIKDENIELS